MNDFDLIFIDETDGKVYDITVCLDEGKLFIDQYSNEKQHQNKDINAIMATPQSDHYIVDGVIDRPFNDNDFPMFPALKNFIERALKMKAFI